jgi:hypothetical protein
MSASSSPRNAACEPRSQSNTFQRGQAGGPDARTEGANTANVFAPSVHDESNPDIRPAWRGSAAEAPEQSVTASHY